MCRGRIGKERVRGRLGWGKSWPTSTKVAGVTGGGSPKIGARKGLAVSRGSVMDKGEKGGRDCAMAMWWLAVVLPMAVHQGQGRSVWLVGKKTKEKNGR